MFRIDLDGNRFAEVQSDPVQSNLTQSKTYPKNIIIPKMAMDSSVAVAMSVAMAVSVAVDVWACGTVIML